MRRNSALCWRGIHRQFTEQGHTGLRWPLRVRSPSKFQNCTYSIYIQLLIQQRLFYCTQLNNKDPYHLNYAGLVPTDV